MSGANKLECTIPCHSWRKQLISSKQWPISKSKPLKRQHPLQLTIFSLSVLYAINTAPVHLSLCIPYAPACMYFNSTGRTVLFFLKLLIITPFGNIFLVKSTVWLCFTPMPFQIPSIYEEQFESELISSYFKRLQWVVFQELDAGTVSSLSVPRKQYIGSANTGGCITIFSLNTSSS